MPLDTWVIYAILRRPTSGSTKILINDANTPGFAFTNIGGKLAAMAAMKCELTDTLPCLFLILSLNPTKKNTCDDNTRW